MNVCLAIIHKKTKCKHWNWHTHTHTLVVTHSFLLSFPICKQTTETFFKSNQTNVILKSESFINWERLLGAALRGRKRYSIDIYKYQYYTYDTRTNLYLLLYVGDFNKIFITVVVPNICTSKSIDQQRKYITTLLFTSEYKYLRTNTHTHTIRSGSYEHGL